MGPRTGIGVLCLGLLAVGCGGGDEREVEALIDELEGIYAETVAAQEERAALAIERVGRPTCSDEEGLRDGFWSAEELESMLARRKRQQEEFETRLLEPLREHLEGVARLRDLLERDAWDEVRIGSGGPVDYVRRAKERAEGMLAAARSQLEAETSGLNEQFAEARSRFNSVAQLERSDCAR